MVEFARVVEATAAAVLVTVELVLTVLTVAAADPELGGAEVDTQSAV